MPILEHWQYLSAHREYWENRNNIHIYEYDPTDDGPEVGIINSIFATATQDVLDEREDALICRRDDDMLADLIEYLHEDLFSRRLNKAQG